MSSPLKKLNVAFHPIDERLQIQMKEDFPNYTDRLVRGEPGGFILSPTYADHAEEIYNLPVRKDDIWVVTFPKCGTTWTQELVWLVTNNCDFETAKATDLDARFPFLEFPYLRSKGVVNKITSSAVAAGAELNDVAKYFVTLDSMKQSPSPRFIKSHLPLYLLPPDLLDTAKVIYVARNPKDVIVSYYFHHKLIKYHDFSKTINEFADYFIKDLVMYAPFFPHLLEAWNQRHHPNLLFLFYEDMKADLRGQVQRIAGFLGKTIPEDKMDQLLQHLRFPSFAENKSVNNEKQKKLGIFNQEFNFIRKGKTGDWKNHFIPELDSRIDEWIEDNLKGSDLKFVMHLDKQD